MVPQTGMENLGPQAERCTVAFVRSFPSCFYYIDPDESNIKRQEKNKMKGFHEQKQEKFQQFQNRSGLYLRAAFPHRWQFYTGKLLPTCWARAEKVNRAAVRCTAAPNNVHQDMARRSLTTNPKTQKRSDHGSFAALLRYAVSNYGMKYVAVNSGEVVRHCGVNT